MNKYYMIQDNTMLEITEKKSKFIANLIYIKNEEEAEEILKNIRKKYYDARHNCYAYRILNESQEIVEKSSDDGEPSGTAGAPMLNILQKNSLYNVIIIVTRYFGGILLGTGGLVRSYSQALQEALETIELVEIEIGYEMSIKVDYKNVDILKYYCKKNEIKIIDINYSEYITLTVEIDEEKIKKLENNTKNKTLEIKECRIMSKKFIRKKH